MNTNLLNIIKQIVAERGEGMLADSDRLKPLFSDLAKDEPKSERIAFGRCVQIGAYWELKNTRGDDERWRKKAELTDQMHIKTGIDRMQCMQALDLMEAAIFPHIQPAVVAPQPSFPPPQPVYPQPQPAHPAPYPQPAANPYAPPGTPPAGSYPARRMLKKRGIISYLLWGIFTLGIYSLWRCYIISRDVNEVCRGDGKHTGGLLAYLFFSLITLGIYAIVWEFKIAERLKNNGRRYGVTINEDGGTVVLWTIFGSLLLGLGPIIAWHIIFKNANTLFEEYNRIGLPPMV